MVRYYLYLFAALFAFGCKTNPPTASQIPTVEYGKIIITSSVAGALIFLDNASTGKITPDTITAAVGNHLVRLEKDGYMSESKSVTVIKDSTVNLSYNLKFSKIILIEDFANVSCNPCVISNKILESIKGSYGFKKVLVVKYPTNFPSPIDPFYTANAADCNARMMYYQIQVAPTTKVDGALTPISSDSNSVKTKIDERILLPAKFKISLTDSLGAGNYNVKIMVEIIDSAGLDFSNLILHTVVVESKIEFTNPPGSNGETIFHDVMRKMLPSNSGETLTYSTSGTQLFTRQVTLNPTWNTSKLETIVFIQNKLTKEILQAGSTYNN